MITLLKYCVVCGLAMSYTSDFIPINTSHMKRYMFSCNNRCCQLPPHSRYIVSYLGNEIIAQSIIVDIGENLNYIHYKLMTYYDKPVTYIGTIEPWILDEDNEYSHYVYKSICKFNYVIPWNDYDSAVEVISRILKIKAFA